MVKLGPVRWIALAGLIGFGAAFVFSDLLSLPRAVFLWPYAGVVTVFLVLYVQTSGIDLRTQFRRRWLGGTIGGVLFGAFMVRGVLTQPVSFAPEGATLIQTLIWLGLVYGVVDALFLNVMPVLATFASRLGTQVMRGFGHRLTVAGAALGASLLVTAAYHLGYAEFRGVALMQPLIGNALITGSYLVTGSPVAPIVAHVMMHGAAVLHGLDTAVQLPPHY